MVCPLSLEKVVAIFLHFECRLDHCAEVRLSDFGERLSLFVHHHDLKRCPSETANVTIVPPPGTKPNESRDYLSHLVNIMRKLFVSYKKPFFRGIGLKCLPTAAYLRHITASELVVRRVVNLTGKKITVPLAVLLHPGNESMWNKDSGIQVLGRGSFGVVVSGALKADGAEEAKEVAIKIMTKQGQLSEIHAADEATGSLVLTQLHGARMLPILGGS